MGAAYLLWLYQRVMFGSVTNPANENMPDLNAREYATLLPLVFLAFWIGIYPAPLFQVLDKPVQRIVQTVNPSYYVPSAPAPPAALSAPAGTVPARGDQSTPSNARSVNVRAVKEGK